MSFEPRAFHTVPLDDQQCHQDNDIGADFSSLCQPWPDGTSLRSMRLLNNTETIPHIPKLSQILFERKDSSFRSLAALPSNVEAIDAALMFSAGLDPFVALVGPSGWGKTHLLQAVAHRLAVNTDAVNEPMSVCDFMANPSKAECSGPLILDDVQEVFGKSRMKMSLRLTLERRFKCGKPTLLAFTSLKPSRALKSFLPYSRDWTVACMGAAEPAERILLLRQLSAVEGLELSHRLSKVISAQVQGDGRTLAGALKRLRLAGTTWLDSSATLRAFGLLEPFFADSCSWDLKHKILKAAEGQGLVSSRFSALDLALYTMLHEAGLSEVDVARTTGIEPAEAYLRSSKFKIQLSESETTRVSVRQFVDSVVESLSRESI